MNAESATKIGAFSSLVSWSKISGTYDDDWIDRTNHIWTVLLLGVFAVVISTGQYILGDPIQCWTPAEFTGQFNSYTHSICWISNTYYVPLTQTIPEDIWTRQEAEISYYQWVPIILLFQAFLFKFPNIAWRLLNGYSGINMEKICTLAESTLLSSPDDRAKNISHIAKYMDRWIECQKDYHKNSFVELRNRLSNIICFCMGKRAGTFLTGYYIFIKLLYCVNIVGQFFILNAFMAMDYNLYGFEVLQNLASGDQWQESPRFPRVTLCDFLVRRLGTKHRWTVQCVLPLNLFNEKIFIFLWFWFLLVAILTFFNCAVWFYKSFLPRNRVNYVKKYLKLFNKLGNEVDKKLPKEFADKYLRNDGVFVLRVVEKNSSGMVLSDLLINLWKIFNEEKRKRETVDQQPVGQGNAYKVGQYETKQQQFDSGNGSITKSDIIMNNGDVVREGYAA